MIEKIIFISISNFWILMIHYNYIIKILYFLLDRFIELIILYSNFDLSHFQIEEIRYWKPLHFPQLERIDNSLKLFQLAEHLSSTTLWCTIISRNCRWQTFIGHLIERNKICIRMVAKREAYQSVNWMIKHDRYFVLDCPLFTVFH